MDMSLAAPSVIGALVAFPQESTAALDKLIPECFADEKLRDIFAACQTLHKSGKPWDVAILSSKLGADYNTLMVECAKLMPSLQNLDAYIELVREAWRRSSVYSALYGVMDNCTNGNMQDVMASLVRIVEEQNTIQKSIDDETAKNFVQAAAEFLVDLDKPNTGMKTGWKDFDYVTGGLQRQGVYVISARSGQGKTDYAINLAMKLCQQDFKVCYNTMEMPRKQIMRRIIARATRINSTRLREKTLTEDEFAQIAKVIDVITRHSKLILDEQLGIDAATVEAKIIRHKPDVLFIDHLGLMQHDKSKRNQWEAIGQTTRSLKQLAMKYNITIVELVQMGREADRTKGDPTMSQLKGSSDIENDADGIFAIKVEKPDHVLTGDDSVLAEVHCIKNRHGSTGKLEYHWRPQYHLWTPMDRIYQ